MKTPENNPSNIVKLGEKRIKEENKKKRAEIEISDDGYLLLPEEESTVTIEEAAQLADQILQEENATA